MKKGKTLRIAFFSIFVAIVFIVYVICSFNGFQANAGPALYFEWSNRITVKNGYIFQNLDLENLYRIPEDGGDKLFLATGVENFFVDDEWVYYVRFEDIRKVRYDGTEDTQIVAGRTGSCMIAGDVIYFTHYLDEAYTGRFCVNTDGTNIRRTYNDRFPDTIYNGKTYSVYGDIMIVSGVLDRRDTSRKSFDLAIDTLESGFRWDGGVCYGYDGWIYYSIDLRNTDTGEIVRTDIRKIRINGKDDQLFLENAFVREISDDGYVYYHDNSYPAVWGRVRIDGTNNQPGFFPALTYAYLATSGDWIYYSQGYQYTERTYWRTKGDNSAPEQITWL